MKNIATVAFAAVLFLAACDKSQELAESTAAGADSAAALSTLFEDHFQRDLEMNPIHATFIGDHRYDDRLANSNSAEFRAAAMAMDEEFLARLLQIDRDELSYQDRLSYDLFKINRELSLEGNQFPFHLQPINQFYAITSFFVQLGSGTSAHPFETVKDYENFLSRADDFSIIIDQIISNMQQGLREGVTQPRILMQKLLPQIESQQVDNIEDSNFYTPVRDMPQDFSREDRERLTAAYRDKISNTILPAYARFSNFLGDEYISSARDTVGLYAQPNGEEWYAYMVRLRTTTKLTPDEIHQIGLDEVARIHKEMHGVMEEVGFEGGLQDFFEFVNTDEQFFYDEPEELIQGYRDMSAHISELATELFDVFPKAQFEVRRIEPFREASAAGGSYQSGTPDGSRPGIFYANAYDIKARGKWAMEALFLHEAIPGHHFQIMIQQENEALPDFRRFGGGFTAYTEGWGLYAESLGKELGVYTDPYQYFGGLNAELWRAIRLVVDTGLHAKQWTRQDVLDYMYANSAVAEVRAVAEAERFMAIPGQALAYKVGQLRILAIRADAEHRLGEAFSVKDFHTEVLRDGEMPLEMLAAKIDRWIESQL
jgi:uncharacterized protein (DUF885 family)